MPLDCCGTTFPNLKAWKTHLVHIHGKGIPATYFHCQICGKELLGNSALIQHQSDKHGLTKLLALPRERQVPCKVWPYYTMSVDDEDHHDAHPDEGPLPADESKNNLYLYLSSPFK
jgi:hypothetical protein